MWVRYIISIVYISDLMSYNMSISIDYRELIFLNIIYSLVFFMLVLLLIEVLAIVLKITGLDIDKARFQVISILTHTGFTTRESELVVQHPLRRKIASILMIISYVGQATLITLIFNLFKEQKGKLNFILILMAMIVLILVIRKNKYFINKLDIILEKYIKKQMMVKNKHKTIDEVLRLNDEFGVTEIIIEERSPLDGVSLKDAQLKDRFIQVLNIDRGSHIIHFPRANFIFQPADRVLVYGKLDSIRTMFVDPKSSVSQ
jgi:hypothetical protein